MIVLLILIPVIAGLISFFISNDKAVKVFSLLASAVTFFITLGAISCSKTHGFEAQWLPQLGSSFSLSLDGMAKMLVLLTALAFPFVFSSSLDNHYAKPNNFYGLMLLMQAGLMGVFLSSDVLLFYFFWELALIPAYFLSSQYGGNKRIQSTFKFFVYTFLGSVIMLVGILYLYFKNPEHSFALSSFYHIKLSAAEQNVAFWLFFIAFAIKMPIFPLHTWQPDAYEQSPTPVTAILSGVMVKMGLYAVIRFVLPLFPDAVKHFNHIIIIFSIIGILYASLIAIKQDDIKRLIAYSSIAHIGLMCAAIFSLQEIGLQGVLLQMFNHGINVIGLWIVANAIEQQTGTRKFSELGGLATKAPVLAILFMVMTLANVALPLTNAFIGEFLMFNGLFRYNIWAAVIAGISIILVAVYSLGAMAKIFYGEVSSHTQNTTEASVNTNFTLIVIAIIIIVLGVYPHPILELVKDIKAIV
ncbi:NADH dehydrogenase [Arachidicoccus ginsenosidimutans]|uniref:complex I subunit 4 family protein n=1 Tax=Arachidicoccus sp. BS20 TaxID=1850526 RepID=UPI0007F099F0|nr:NADH-quinone oxidoreductase subunit M [Arachidicoccus sp. BS20]ANI90199.1 NADH dehydrogenase [Arachidicoccus sp. BS20]